MYSKLKKIQENLEKEHGILLPRYKVLVLIDWVVALRNPHTSGSVFVDVGPQQ